jgi:diaminopimelate decarboxylase
MGEIDHLLKSAAAILQKKSPEFDRQLLNSFVDSYLQRRQRFLDSTAEHGSPLYIIEQEVLKERAAQFSSAFQKHLPDIRVYYAVKCNNSPEIARILVDAGLGLDVSSGLELQMALDVGATNIIFSGPAKMPDELKLAVRHHDKVTVLIDSFRELNLLEQIAGDAGIIMRAGVRLTVDNRGLWRKFGVPLDQLAGFFTETEKCSHIRLRGLQFHTSWNMEPSGQVNFIAKLGKILAELPKKHQTQIEFVDIGGGYWPSQGEWVHPIGTPEGKLREAIEPSEQMPQTHFCIPAAPIDQFARQIGDAIKAHIFPHCNCRIFMEPGRWIVHDGMHILITVIDRKGNDLVIADAGTNTLGWERLETDYFPVINLSRPELSEHPCYVLGSLCTPHDVWGYGYFGSAIQPGDILLIPTQGAYTYSLRQHFIKPLPKTAII